MFNSWQKYIAIAYTFRTCTRMHHLNETQKTEIKYFFYHETLSSFILIPFYLQDSPFD